MKKKHIVLLLVVLTLFCCLLTACGKDKNISLTLVKDGSDTSVVEVAAGAEYTLPVPERDGYAFLGWYSSEDFSGDSLTTVTPTEAMTLWAKWEKVYTLTLDTAGGTLSTTKLQLKAGENIYDAVKDLIPTKANCEFGKWVLNGAELGQGDVMKAANTTLTAKYKVAYSVEIYLQNTTLDGYEKSKEVITGYAYAGDSFTSNQAINGFQEVTKDGSVVTKVISEDPAENLFRHYFDRSSYTLTFVSNYPDGSANERSTVSVVYGIPVELPFVTFEADGYYLEGWSTVATGAPEYDSHVMDDRLYNAEAPAWQTITPEGNVTLYAVWSQGYTDLFGGEDVMYVSVADPKVVYLYRGDRFFKGEVAKNGDIYFYDSNDDILYQGKLAPTGSTALNPTFLYKEDSRSEVISTLYVVGKGLDSNTKIYFDKENGIKYSVLSGTGSTDDSKGTYVFDEDGYLVATFTEGSLAGKTLTMVIGTVTLSSGTTSAFQVRNEEEYALGQIVHFQVKGNTLVVAKDDNDDPVNDITMLGFGIATYNAGDSTKGYYYTYDPETMTLTLMTSDGSVAGVFRLMYVGGVLGYMTYDKSLDVTYTLDSGATLTLDGIRTATFVNGDVTASGYFTMTASVFGGKILTFTDNGVTYKFMISTVTESIEVEVTDPDTSETTTEIKTETKTIVEQKHADYAEYYYKNADSYYYAPLFVYGEPQAGWVTVYGYTPSKTYVKMAEGTFVYDAATGTYTFSTVNRFDAPDVFKEPVDFATVKSCVVVLDSTATKYSINFWLSYTTEETATDLSTVYSSEDGSKITLVAGLAIYSVNGNFEVGTVSTKGSLTTIVTANRTLYVELDDETHTYTTFKFAPFDSYEVNKDGTIAKDKYLTLDPKNGVSYHVVTTETVDGEEVQTTTDYPGILYDADRTSLTGFPVYLFVSNAKVDGTEDPLIKFYFIQISTSSGTYIFIEDTAYGGTYLSENGSLSLDGFGYAGKYADNTGLDIIGMYTKTSDTEVQIYANNRYYYFDLNGTTCTLRGDEYGKTYLLMDNQAFQGLYVTPDGYSHFVIFKSEVSGEESVKVPVDENGVYSIDGDYVTLTYQNGIQTVTLICKMSTMESGDYLYNTLVVTHEEVVSSYVNESDWSVLILKDDGTAIKYLTDGSAENGSYSIVTDSLLYYVNEEGTDACIYEYDTEKGTATPHTYPARAYYTEDLQSLLFSKYGFAIFNNETRYYYTVKNNRATIYHLDAENANANEYGYVAEDFGDFSAVKEYNGKTYYSNDGYAIKFMRNPETAGYYPVLLSSSDPTKYPLDALMFTPTGDAEFTVACTVVINGKNFDYEHYKCTVTRKLNEEGVPEMYLNLGNYRFDITISYHGENSVESTASTYEVTGMHLIITARSYTWMEYYYLYYSYFGSSFANSFTNKYGVIQLRTDFDTEGNEIESYVNATFGESSKMYDANGNLIASLDKADVTQLENGLYLITFTGADGYQYSLYITLKIHKAFQAYGYIVNALVREETLTANDGYQVTVGRVITSESKSISKGDYFSFELSKDNTAIDNDGVYLLGGTLYYVVRTEDEDGKITSTTYYKLVLTEKSSGTVGGEEETSSNVLPVYESATVTPVAVSTLYNTAGDTYADIMTDDNKVVLLSINGTTYFVSDCQYDTETGVYTVTTSADTSYTITVIDGVITVTEVTNTSTTEV